jgi:molybdate transport system substrate-binding protein
MAFARAAEIRLLSSNAFKTALEELGPQFETATGHKLVITFGAAAELKASIETGAPFDLAILSSSATDDLIRQGKLVSATRTELARSGAGVAIRKGARKPDIATSEAFRRTLLEATSIAYVEQGASGIYLKGLFQRLGIAEELKAKTKLLPASNPAAQAIANGEAEIGITQISEILPYAGTELAGPLPPDVQLHTVFLVAVGASARQPEAARALIEFLTSPEAASVLTAKGLEPG